jgi:hypothetical protein
MTRFQCSVCGKVTAGRCVRIPWNKGMVVDGVISYRYNTDFRYPRKHHIDGAVCVGSFMEAEQVETVDD